MVQAAALGHRVRAELRGILSSKLFDGLYLRALHQWPRDRVDRASFLLFCKGTEVCAPWPRAFQTGGAAAPKATSAKQARELKALKAADDVQIFEHRGAYYEVPNGPAGGVVAGAIVSGWLAARRETAVARAAAAPPTPGAGSPTPEGPHALP